uniref:Pre-rRNA-processing protein TSR2 homolog n=1 Tax=Steinernema glaseri TaxID=37863 RepID=A0A1I7ZZT9_9BILA
MPPSTKRKHKKDEKSVKIRCWQVPFNRVEWAIVRNLFQSNDPDHLNVVLNMLSMWKTRMGRNTPLAVNISEFLIRARQMEATAGEWTWETETRLEMTYSTAIIRFINYVNEMGQKALYRMTSIAESLRPFGIPEWVINARHASTHKNMPTVNILRAAVDFCRAWLWTCYWDKPIEESVQWKQVTDSRASTSTSTPAATDNTANNNDDEIEVIEDDDVIVDEDHSQEIFTVDDLKNLSTKKQSDSSDEPEAKKTRTESTASESEIIVLDTVVEAHLEDGNSEADDEDGWKLSREWNVVCPMGLTPEQTSESLCLGFSVQGDCSSHEPVVFSLDMYPDVIDHCSMQFPPICIDEKKAFSAMY